MSVKKRSKEKIQIYIVIIMILISVIILTSIGSNLIVKLSNSSFHTIPIEKKYINETISLKKEKTISPMKEKTNNSETNITTSSEMKNQSYNPVFNTKLWDYSIKCDFSGFEGVCNPKSYIMPNNEVIDYISSLMYLSDGGLYWKDNYFNETGLFSGEFIFDKDQFNNKDDYWINPDYYFMNGMRGDCEDISVAIASILENKGVRTKVVGGWITQNNIRSRDWIVEYKIGSVYYRYYGGVFNLVFIPRGIFELRKQEYGINFEPVLMFDKNSYYESYNSNW